MDSYQTLATLAITLPVPFSNWAASLSEDLLVLVRP